METAIRHSRTDFQPSRLLNVLKAENDRDIYLIFEYMETDLHAGKRLLLQLQNPRNPPAYKLTCICVTVIRANILEEIHKQYIMYQLFKSLKFMHSAELLHRDVKVSAIESVRTLFELLRLTFKPF